MMSFQVYSEFKRQNTQAVFFKAMAAAPAVPMSLGTPVATILEGPTSRGTLHPLDAVGLFFSTNILVFSMVSVVVVLLTDEPLKSPF